MTVRTIGLLKGSGVYNIIINKTIINQATNINIMYVFTIIYSYSLITIFNLTFMLSKTQKYLMNNLILFITMNT